MLAGAGYALGGIINPYHDSTTWQWIYIPVVVLVGWSFLFAGLVATRRRPANPTGLLISLVGLAWFGTDFGWFPTPWGQESGLLLKSAFLAVLAHLYIVYPRGRPSGARELAAVIAVYSFFVVSTLVTNLTYDAHRLGCQACASNPIYLPAGASLNPALSNISAAMTAIIAAVVLGLVAMRWARASRPARRTLAPAIWSAGPIFLVVLAIQLNNLGLVPAAAEQVLGPLQLVAFGLLPLALMVGVLRTQLGRAAVSDLVLALSRAPLPGTLRDLLARALGDPSLELALALPGGGFVDSQGTAMRLPEAGSRRGVTVIATEGRPMAALVHDPLLDESDPGLVAAAGSAALLALENERLQAEVLATLEEVRASRVRILEAADAERRRVERDIHDGAQQRLVALGLTLRLARNHAATTGDEQLATELEGAADQLKGALAELRELAQGIHPATLSRAGIGPALRSLAELSPVPVEIRHTPHERLPAGVEAAAYFVVSEALANTAKHAGASRISVVVKRTGDLLMVDIQDDGSGGAGTGGGSGLVGIRDRVTALGGRLEISSPRGVGTTIHVEIPCG
jgi:signal transduction histidine kinase